MAVYRCLKHDRVFESYTDNRPPNSLATPDKKFPAMPLGGHPDCPMCQLDKEQGSGGSVEVKGSRKIA